jgi:hypothetical protein
MWGCWRGRRWGAGRRGAAAVWGDLGGARSSWPGEAFASPRPWLLAPQPPAAAALTSQALARGPAPSLHRRPNPSPAQPPNAQPPPCIPHQPNPIPAAQPPPRIGDIELRDVLRLPVDTRMYHLLDIFQVGRWSCLVFDWAVVQVSVLAGFPLAWLGLVLVWPGLLCCWS